MSEIIIEHSDAATEWALSTDRTVVFSVTSANPLAGQPIVSDDPEQDPGIEPDELVHHYTMPSKPNAGLALEYLRKARQNADLAMSWIIETAIGSDGYDALVAELAGVEPKEMVPLLQGVTERIQRVAMGGLDGQGNAPKA